MPSFLNARNICVCVCAGARVFEWVWESTCLCMRYSEILIWVLSKCHYFFLRFCFHFLKWSIIALQYCFSFYSTTWISSTYAYPLLVSSFVLFCFSFSLKYFAISFAYCAFKFSFFQEAFLDPIHNPLFFALCIPLLVCSPHHAACYLFICLSLLTLKVLEGKVTALLISVSPVPIPIGIAWAFFDLKWIIQMVNEYFQFCPMKARWD